MATRKLPDGSIARRFALSLPSETVLGFFNTPFVVSKENAVIVFAFPPEVTYAKAPVEPNTTSPVTPLRVAFGESAHELPLIEYVRRSAEVPLETTRYLPLGWNAKAEGYLPVG